ncbi:MAG TPA: MFS transporter [Fimbriimonas sp.]
MSATQAPEATPVKRPAVIKMPAVWRLLIIALLAEIGYGVLNISTMPVYLAGLPQPGGDAIFPNGRGMGTSVVGIVLVAFLLSEAIFKSPMGTLADRYGHKRLMLLGPAITAVTSLLSLVVPHGAGGWEVLAFVVLRVFDGIGAAMLWPAAFALMGNSVEDTERQQAMSLLNLCYMLGIAVAPLSGGIVNDLSGVRWAGLVLASVLFAVVSVAVWFLIPGREPHEKVKAAEQHAEAGFADFLNSMRQIPSYLVLAIVVFAGIGFPMAIIKIFAQDEFAMSESKFGMLVFPAALAMAIFSVPLSKFGERIGKARAVHWGIGLCAAGLIFISLGAFVPLLRMPWALALGGIPLGIGFLLAIPAWMASVSDIDPARRGANIGAVMTAQGIGAIIGAPIGSALYGQSIGGRIFESFPSLQPHLAHYSPFIGCAACVFTGWLLSLRLLQDPR